ncbi:unnamed protein product [Parnassius mnemosyne]|uniref:Uncharacterized protein n=1 Tax=Parnassius mnemosyne TaxID=213953 RepID=A0AAV1KB62_9NEOP
MSCRRSRQNDLSCAMRDIKWRHVITKRWLHVPATSPPDRRISLPLNVTRCQPTRKNRRDINERQALSQRVL